MLRFTRYVLGITVLAALPSQAWAASPQPLPDPNINVIPAHYWIIGQVVAGFVVTAIVVFMLNRVLMQAFNVDATASSRVAIITFLVANYAWIIYQLNIVNLPPEWWTVITVVSGVFLVIAIAFMFASNKR